MARKSLNGTASETEEAVPFHLIPSFFNNVDYLITVRYTYLKICVKAVVYDDIRVPFSGKVATQDLFRRFRLPFSEILAT